MQPMLVTEPITKEVLDGFEHTIDTLRLRRVGEHEPCAGNETVRQACASYTCDHAVDHLWMLPDDRFDLRRADVNAMHLDGVLITNPLVTRAVGRGRTSLTFTWSTLLMAAFSTHEGEGNLRTHSNLLSCSVPGPAPGVKVAE